MAKTFPETEAIPFSVVMERMPGIVAELRQQSPDGAASREALLAFLDGLGLAAEVSAGESRDQATGPVCFQSAGQHEVKVGGRKLIGSAQRRAGGVFLQHGSILTGPAHRRLLECLGEDRNGAISAAEEGLAEVATDLGELLGRDLRDDDHDDLARRLAQAFAVCFACEAVAYRPDF